jgi:hypothetical protein
MTLRERREVMANIEKGAGFAELKIRAFAVGPKSIDLIIDEPLERDLDDEEMFRRYEETGTSLFEKEKPLLDAKNKAAWGRLRKRFGDLSTYLKTLKQLTTQHYHHQHGTSGALWEARFRSSSVQPGNASRVLAAWIQFSNVRAGLVTAPAKDETCSLGSGAKGSEWAREMVADLFLPGEKKPKWQAVMKAFKSFVAGEPENLRSQPAKSKRDPLLTRSQLMLAEVPHFATGVALGEREFVEELFKQNKSYFAPERTTGARRIVGQNDNDLWTLRQKVDLRKLAR